MKYIKPFSTVLIGNTGKSKSSIHLESTETLGFFTENKEGEEEIIAIAFSREQLIELRNTIDLYIEHSRKIKPPKTAVANNFSIKAHSDISEAETVRMFDRISKQVVSQLFSQE